MRDITKMKVKKRDGTLVEFNPTKIGIAIHKAFIGSGNEDKLKETTDLISNLEQFVVNTLCDSDIELTVENIQDVVESTLMKYDLQDVAKHYILYRDMRSRNREANSKTTKLMRELTFSKSSESDIKRENGNINGDTSMGLMLKYGSENAKEYALDEVLKPEHGEAHRNGDIHIHDLDFYTTGTLTCDQIDIHRLFHGGFTTGHGYLREPNSIRSYAALACIAIQANQNDMHGGQSIPNFDFVMAEGVDKSFKKAIVHNIESYIRLNTGTEVDHEQVKTVVNELCKKGYKLNEYREFNHVSNDMKYAIFDVFHTIIPNLVYNKNVTVNIDNIIKQSIADVVEETHQAMEAVVHNLNSMHCLPGSERIWVRERNTKKIRLITMEELHNTFSPNKYEALSINMETGETEFKQIIASKDQGTNRNIVTLTTENGARIRVTDNHKVLSIDKSNGLLYKDYPKDVSSLISSKGIKTTYNENKLIQISDYLIKEIYPSTPIKLKELPITEELAYLFGIYVAGGSIIDGSSMSLATCMKFDIETLSDLVNVAFGQAVEYNIYYMPDDDRIKDIRFNIGTYFGEFIKNACGINSGSKCVPDFIFTAKSNIQIAFLNGYFATNGRRGSKYIEATTVSKNLASGIVFLIHKLGELPYYTEYSSSHSGFTSNYPRMYKISLGNKSARRIGLYDPSFIKDIIGRSAYISRRASNTIRYSELEDVITYEERKQFKHLLNVFNVPIDTVSEDIITNEHVYDISVKDNENFITENMIAVSNSRAGSQVPFSSLNYGMDTSDAGRLVIKEILNAVMDGMGNGETAIFPISIFAVKDGVNFKPGDVNYDLYRYSMKVTAKRLFPNYLFIDAPFNLQYYREGDINSIVATMGAVSESEMITYVVGGIVHYSDFGTAYNTVKAYANDNEKIYGLSRYINTENMNVFIKDRGKFVRVKKFIRNINYHNWHDVTFGIFEPCVKICMTMDHPLPVSKNGTSIRTKLEDLKVGDYVFTEDGRSIRILNIEPNKVYRGCGYDVETESDRFDVSGINSHNCRTRVIGNVHGPEVTMRRGNTSFTTINLPRIGLKHRGDIDGFFKELDEKLKLVEDQLYERLKFQGKKRVYNFPFLMGNGNWIGSEDLGPDDELFEIIKNGSLSIGFIGLAETLVALIGKHHGESKEAQELGLKIIGHMRDYCDDAAKRTGLNYSLLGTPAEGLSGRFIRMDKKLFGEVKGITDRDYYTNSSHVPVYYNINAFEKIEIEAPYHALCNAGHIGYIELDGDPSKNIDAIEEILAWMKECGIGYGSINHPVDYDPVCGYTGIIDDVCPRCGRHEYEGVSIEKLRSLGVWKDYNASTIGYHGDNYEEEDRTPNSI